MSCKSVAPSHAKTIGTNFSPKSFHAIINLVYELLNTIEFPLRIIYFTSNFTDMLVSSSESYGGKQKMIGFIVIISQRGVCKSYVEVEDLYTWP